jgi:hypothetical protein
MKISLIVEGDTEVAFRDALRRFLEPRLPGCMPKLDPVPCDGRVPTGEKLRRRVRGLLDGSHPPDAVIALTDVYTGTRAFENAADAKSKMRSWVGDEPRFHPHAAQHDFEAWLLPYWDTIQRLAKHNKAVPAGPPEGVNHLQPPSRRIAEVFRAGKCRTHYSKVRDGKRILRDVDLLESANQCPELREILNTILDLCGGQEIPAPQLGT